MNFSDPEHLTRLFAYMRMNNRAAILEAERGLLKEEIRTMELERDAAVASTVATFEPELTERRKRLEDVESRIAGEQIGLFRAFKVGPVAGAFDIKCAPSVDAKNAQQLFDDKLTEILDAGLTTDAFPNVQSNPDYGNNGPVLLPYDVGATNSTMPVGDDANKATAVGNGEKTDGFKSTFNGLSDWLDNNPEAMYNTPRNAQVVTRDGQTFFVFKSAGYKAIAERLGFPFRPMMDGYKRYMLTPKEYDEVFKADQDRKSERRWRVEVGRPLEIDG